MAKIHHFDTAWETILEAFEVEIVELLFLEFFCELENYENLQRISFYSF